MNSPASLQRCPPEVVAVIFEELAVKDILHMRLVCKCLNEMFEANRAIYLLRTMMEEFSPFPDLILLYTALSHPLDSGGFHFRQRYVTFPVPGNMRHVTIMQSRRDGDGALQNLFLDNSHVVKLWGLCRHVLKWERLYIECRFADDRRRHLTAPERFRLRRALYRASMYDLYFHVGQGGGGGGSVSRCWEWMPHMFITDARTCFLRHYPTAELVEMLEFTSMKINVVAHKLCPSLEEKWGERDGGGDLVPRHLYGGQGQPSASTSAAGQRRDDDDNDDDDNDDDDDELLPADPSAWFRQRSRRRPYLEGSYAKLTPAHLTALLEANPQGRRAETVRRVRAQLPAELGGGAALAASVEHLSYAITAVLAERRALWAHGRRTTSNSALQPPVPQQQHQYQQLQARRRRPGSMTTTTIHTPPPPPPRRSPWWFYAGSILSTPFLRRVPKRYTLDGSPHGRQRVPVWWGGAALVHTLAAIVPPPPPPLPPSSLSLSRAGGAGEHPEDDEDPPGQPAEVMDLVTVADPSAPGGVAIVRVRLQRTWSTLGPSPILRRVLSPRRGDDGGGDDWDHDDGDDDDDDEGAHNGGPRGGWSLGGVGGNGLFSTRLDQVAEDEDDDEHTLGPGWWEALGSPEEDAEWFLFAGGVPGSS